MKSVESCVKSILVDFCEGFTLLLQRVVSSTRLVVTKDKHFEVDGGRRKDNRWRLHDYGTEMWYGAVENGRSGATVWTDR